MKGLEITPERVMAEYAKLAFSDMRRIATYGPNGVALKDQSEIADDDSAAIAELSETRTKDGGSIRFKLHDKKGALDSIARTLGMFTDKTEITGKGGAALFASMTDEELLAQVPDAIAMIERRPATQVRGGKK